MNAGLDVLPLSTGKLPPAKWKHILNDKGNPVTLEELKKSAWKHFQHSEHSQQDNDDDISNNDDDDDDHAVGHDDGGGSLGARAKPATTMGSMFALSSRVRGPAHMILQVCYFK